MVAREFILAGGADELGNLGVGAQAGQRIIQVTEDQLTSYLAAKAASRTDPVI